MSLLSSSETKFLWFNTPKTEAIAAIIAAAIEAYPAYLL
jgi:hypothetical protein